MTLFVKAVLRSPHGTELEGWLDPGGHRLRTLDRVRLGGAVGVYTITSIGKPEQLPKGTSYFTVTAKVS